MLCAFGLSARLSRNYGLNYNGSPPRCDEPLILIEKAIYITLYTLYFTLFTEHLLSINDDDTLIVIIYTLTRDIVDSGLAVRRISINLVDCSCFNAF